MDSSVVNPTDRLQKLSNVSKIESYCEVELAKNLDRQLKCSKSWEKLRQEEKELIVVLKQASEVRSVHHHQTQEESQRITD